MYIHALSCSVTRSLSIPRYILVPPFLILGPYGSTPLAVSGDLSMNRKPKKERVPVVQHPNDVSPQLVCASTNEVLHRPNNQTPDCFTLQRTIRRRLHTPEVCQSRLTAQRAQDLAILSRASGTPEATGRALKTRGKGWIGLPQRNRQRRSRGKCRCVHGG